MHTTEFIISMVLYPPVNKYAVRSYVIGENLYLIWDILFNDYKSILAQCFNYDASMASRVSGAGGGGGRTN